jgi:outer membrane protein assembly factor BamB
MRKKVAIIMVLLLLLTSVISCFQGNNLSDKRTGWGLVGGTNRRYFSKDRIFGEKPIISWDIKLTNTMTWSNIVSDGKFLYALINGVKGFEIVKIREETGRVLGGTVFRDLPESLYYQLELVDNFLVVLCDTELITINTDKMSSIWTNKTRYSKIQSMTVSKNHILCVSSNAVAYSLSLETGMPVWDQQLDDGFDYQFITVCDDVAIVTGFGLGEGNSLTLSLRVPTGEILWTYISKGVATKPSQIRGNYVFITEKGKFSCHDINHGNLIWGAKYYEDETGLPEIIDVTPSIADEEVVMIKDGEMIVLDLFAGHRVKTVALPENLMPKFILQSKNYIFIVSDGEPFMYKYDRNNYELLAVFSGGKREITGALITDRIILQARSSIVCYWSELSENAE